MKFSGSRFIHVIGLMAGMWGLTAGCVAAAPMSLQVVDGDVRSVLMSTARLGGFNLVLDDSVKGTVTINLRDVEPEEILRFVASVKNLALDERDGTFILASSGSMAGLHRIHAFPIRYGKPEVLQEALKLSLQRAGKTKIVENKEKDGKDKSPSSKVTKAETEDSVPRIFLDSNTNTLLLYGTEAEAAVAGQVLRQLDVPARQVSLEAKVVAIQKDASKKLGIEWEWSGLPQYPEVEQSYETRRRSVTNADGSVSIVREDVPKTEVRRYWQGGSAIPGIIQFGRGPEGYPYEFYYMAKINALITEGKANILAKPNITTIQGQEAVINIGGEIPVPTISTTNNTTTTSIDYKEAGIILRCTPRVNEDGYITSEVHTEVSSPLYVEDLKAYRIQKRSADTMVRLKDGETMVIGGLIGSEESRSLSKVPFLGDLPILGNFFRSVKTSKTESEIMIFLTAHILE